MTTAASDRTKARTNARAILAIVVLASVGCAKAGGMPAPAVAGTEQESTVETLAAPQLPDRDKLPDQAREMLHSRMLRHGEQLVYLVTSVLLLDYASTARLADGLAQEPKLGRPRPGEKDTLNGLLPAAFFAHQDALTTHARALGVAARAHDDAALAESFAAVTKTCIGCHAAYLDDDVGFPLHDEHDESELCDPDDPSCSESTRDVGQQPRIARIDAPLTHTITTERGVR